jgi:hypothetical protein
LKRRAGPATYAEWTDALHRLETGDSDDEVLHELSAARMELSGGQAERLSRRVTDLFRLRVQRIADSVGKRLGARTNDLEYDRAIVAARHELGALARLVGASFWPQDFGKTMRASLDEFARMAQEELEKTARRAERDDQGRMLSLVRRLPLQVPWPDAATSTAPAGSKAQPAPDRPSGRRIIF